MSRLRGPLDGGQTVTRLELLDAIDRAGPNWPALLSHYTLEAVSTAVGRETVARNLLDGATLSEQGRRLLDQLRSAPHADLVIDLRLPAGNDVDQGDELGSRPVAVPGAGLPLA